MTTPSIARVRASFDVLLPQLDAVIAHCHELLFSARPDVRQLFGDNLAPHRRHLASALALLVRNVAVLDTLQQPLRELGLRHAHSGVRPDHYPAIVDALLVAMATSLDAAWTPELANDWAAVLLSISRTMLAGAAEPTAVANA